MKTRLLKAHTLLLIAILFAPQRAGATQVIYQTPQQLGAKSSLVVQGRVTAVESFWNDKGTKIFTRTTVAVAASFKGAGPTTVDILQLGGVVGTVKVTVHGALQWSEGEEVLLFLEPYVGKDYQVSGFSQGKYSVIRDADGKPYVHRPGMKGVELVNGPTGTSASADTPVKAMPLDDFVRSALNGKGGSR